MLELVELGKAILGPQPGATLLLFVIAGLLGWAYWKEKKRNETVQTDRLKESKEETELFVSALNEATYTIKEFKSTNEALKIGFETLARSVTSFNRRDD